MVKNGTETKCSQELDNHWTECGQNLDKRQNMDRNWRSDIGNQHQIFLCSHKYPFLNRSMQVFSIWIFGRIWCSIWLAVDVWTCTASILHLVVIRDAIQLSFNKLFNTIFNRVQDTL